MIKNKIIKSILSAALTGAMTLSVLGGLSVNAEEAATTEKIYKMSELLSMSKEEFLAIDGAYEAYRISLSNSKERQFPPYTSFIMTYAETCLNSKEYKPYYTMKKLIEILDEPIEEGTTYCVYDKLIFPSEGEYENPKVGVNINLKEPVVTVNGDKDYSFFYDVGEMIKEDVILKFAKLTFCINQVIGLHQSINPEGNLPVTIKYGDANDDGKISIYDAAFIAKKIATRKQEELTEAADINSDGEINLQDCVYIARLMNARHMAKAEGWF